jgi:hypothetical protein
MSFRHAAALTLVGWYLMVPSDSPTARWTDPLAKWQVYRSYDSAEECQAAIDAYRNVLTEHEQDHSRFDNLTPQQRDEEITKEAEWEWMFGPAQCIASDDPRLKGD